MTLPYRIYIRDASLARVAEIARYTGLVAVRRHNAGGIWTLRLPAEAVAAQLINFTPTGYGAAGIIIVDAEERTWLSGPWVRITRTNTATGDELEIEGVDDTATLGDRWAEPSPFPYTASSHDEQTGRAETLLHTYVARNAIAGVCAPGRELPGLIPGIDQARGSTFTMRARFDNLLELCQRIAAVDGLGFRVAQQAGPTRALETSVPRDRTNEIVFTPQLGNIDQWERTETAAGATVVVVAGQGEGTQRQFVQRADETAIARYGRREIFVDRRDQNNVTELENAAIAALAEQAGGIALRLEPRDTLAIRYGRDYEVGDRVSVELDGERLTAVVSAVELRQDVHGWRITPTLNTAPTNVAPTSGPRALAARVSALERTVETFTLGMIVAWRRPIGEIPSGWQLADGTLGTLDLRGRFLVGVQVGDPRWGAIGATGGSATTALGHSHGMTHTHGHSHDMSHMHNHSHGMTHTHGHSHGMGHTHLHNHTIASSTFNHHHTVALDHAHTLNTSDLGHSHNHSHTVASHAHTIAAHYHDVAAPPDTDKTGAPTGDAQFVTKWPHSHITTQSGGGNTGDAAPGTSADATAASYVHTSLSLGVVGSVLTSTDSMTTADLPTSSDSTASSATTTSSDSTASSATTTSSDSTASSATTTGTDSTASSATTTGIDSTASSAATTDSALGVVDTVPPFAAVYWIERIV